MFPLADKLYLEQWYKECGIMSAAKNMQAERSNGHKLSGSGKWSDYGKRQPSRAVSWDDVPPECISAAVVAVTSGGDALLFGRTSNGDTLVVTLCSGDQRYKLYAADAGEMDTLLCQLARDAQERNGH